MSVIAFDGITVAADRQATRADKPTTTKKLIKLSSGIVVGFTGDIDKGMTLVRWFEDGERKNEFPSFQLTDNWVRLIVFKPDTIYFYESTPDAIEVLDEKTAFGCGADLAIGAMAMGANAIKAVEIASLHNINCGMGIDWFMIR